MHIFRPEKAHMLRNATKHLCSTLYSTASHDFPCSIENMKIPIFSAFFVFLKKSLIFQILFTEFVDWALEKNLDIEDDTEPEAAPAPAEEEAAAPAEEAPAAAEEAPAAEEKAAEAEAEAAPAE